MAVGEYGGAERSLRLAEALPNHDVTVLMASLGVENRSREVSDKLKLITVLEDKRVSSNITQYASRVTNKNLDIALFSLGDRMANFRRELERYKNDTDLVILDHVGIIGLVHNIQFNVPVIYASHNCETSLAEQMYPQLKSNVASIKTMEKAIIDKSNAITYCSKEDWDKIEDLFHPNVPAFYIPNGTDVPNLPKVRNTSYSKDVIFIGSGHPPNVVAAKNLISVAYAMPEYRFHIIGKCGQSLTNVPSNVIIHGHISDSLMDSLFKSSLAFINPMVEGSGTHLKVMRSLSYALPIISSPTGLRGFTPEEINDTMIVATTTDEMVAAIHSLSDEDYYTKLSSNTLKLSENYAWPKIQGDFQEAVESILGDINTEDKPASGNSSKEKVLVYSIIRNNAGNIDAYYSQLRSVVQRFSNQYEFYLSIYENDSTDQTRNKLFSKDWSFFSGVSIITEDLNTPYFGSVKDAERVELLANARNKAIEAGDFLNHVDYVLMVEGDNTFDADSVGRLLNFKKKEPEFDIVSAVSLRPNGSHYDWWATRTGPEYKPGASEIPRNFRTEEYGRFYSTSNGLCLYRADAFKKGARYGYINTVTNTPDCEMVVICQKFQELGHGNIFINYQSKSYH